MKKLINTYGKTFHTWQVDRGDTLPLGNPPHPLLALCIHMDLVCWHRRLKLFLAGILGLLCMVRAKMLSCWTLSRHVHPLPCLQILLGMCQKHVLCHADFMRTFGMYILCTS